MSDLLKKYSLQPVINASGSVTRLGGAPMSQAVIDAMADLGFLAGFDLGSEYPKMKNSLLVCVTETKTRDDIDDPFRQPRPMDKFHALRSGEGSGPRRFNNHGITC